MANVFESILKYTLRPLIEEEIRVAVVVLAMDWNENVGDWRADAITKLLSELGLDSLDGEGFTLR